MPKTVTVETDPQEIADIIENNPACEKAIKNLLRGTQIRIPMPSLTAKG